ncbi:MAG: ABC transporter permease [Victivallaceae bacterium]|nr:ABC transporter permease [Victivallaceae bacterium]
MNRFAKQLLPFSTLIFIISLWTFLVPCTFLTAENMMNVLTRSAANGIMAAGMTFVIISSGIDLSVGSMLGISGMMGALSMLVLSGGSWASITSGQNIDLVVPAMVGGTLVSVLVGGLCGLFNGVCITRLKLAPFIVTLGSMSIFRGLSYIINDSRPYATADYIFLDSGMVLGIPASIWLFALTFAICSFLLGHTRFGRYVYAIGSNRDTAFLAGIDVNKVLVMVYTLIGLLTGIGAMIYCSRSSSAQPTAGIALEMDVIAACIIGGCSPSGGKGTMTGTLIGTLLISFLRNGLALLGMSTNLQLVVIGFIIIFAVTADRLATSRESN